MSDDAKVLTPAEAECLPEHGDEDGGMPGVVLVDRDDLLATTRALETAQMAETKAAAAAMREWDSLKHEFESSVATLRARAEKAESERDEARGEARAHRAALDDATASCHGLGCGRCEDCVSMQRARAEKAESEHDAARARVAELVTAMEGLFVEYDNLRSAGSKHALTYWVDRLPDHACAECVPGGPIVVPGFRCREHAARAALAKSKGTAS